MTARSPSARSAPSRCRRWRRAAANCCGTSAPVPARSSIEWMLADPSMRAIAIEADAGARRPHRAATHRPAACPASGSSRARRPPRLPACRRPTPSSSAAAARDAGVLDAAIAALTPGGRLVANAVTLEMEALLLAEQATLGGDLDPHRHCARRAGRRDAGLAAGHAGHAMVVGEAMIVAGIGCKQGRQRRRGVRPPSRPRWRRTGWR